MKHVAAAVLLLALLGAAACGDPVVVTSEVENTSHTPSVPPWAKVAPEQIAEAKKHGVPVAFENEMGMRFVLVPSGTFLMGAPEGTPPRERSMPQHEVTLTRPFYVQVMEVTNEAYRRYRPDHDAEELARQGSKTHRITFRGATTFGGAKYGPELNEDRQPVTYVSWHDVCEFAAWITDRGDGRRYRLPTEAEWEYACRAGTTTAYAFGETLSHEQARFGPARFSDPPPYPRRAFGIAEVGDYDPNAWGLHDMHGNVSEWCGDWFGPYAAERAEDPTGPQEGDRKVIRGGSANTMAGHLDSARRWMTSPDDRTGWRRVGFRLVSPLPESSK